MVFSKKIRKIKEFEGLDQKENLVTIIEYGIYQNTRRFGENDDWVRVGGYFETIDGIKCNKTNKDNIFEVLYPIFK